MNKINAIIKQLLLAFTFLLAAGLILSSCGGTEDPTPDIGREDNSGPSRLFRSVKITTITKDVLRGVAAQNEIFEPLIQYMDYDMSLYRIVYETNYKGVDILVSGLISVPEGIENPPLLSAHHGTIFANNAAPSNVIVNLASGGILGYELFGAAGYITFVADYIGYAESDGVQHPYYDKDLTASTIIDMIIAGREFLDQEGITYKDDLYLMGYSEGGFATMATLQALESPSDTLNYNIKAVAAGAGGYDIKGIMDDVLNRTEHPEPGFLGFVLRSYNETYEWNRPYTDFFQEPYASRIANGLLDGGNTKDGVNEQLTSVIDDYIQPDFKSGLLNGTATQVLDAMNKNTVHNWTPQAEVRFYHAAADEVLTIDNSRFTVHNMENLGAPNVSLHEISGNSHREGAFTMIIEVVEWFNSMQ